MHTLRRLAATAALWWRTMRMQRITREGWFYVGFTLVVGAAAINTGNNLLYLVLGLQVSLLLLSAFLSEAVLGGLRVERVLPPNGVVGQALRVELRIRNRKRRLASHSLFISEIGVEGASLYVPRIGPRSVLETSWTRVETRRGRLALHGIRISTRFPFGLFEKIREQRLEDFVLVHPEGRSKATAGALVTRAEGAVPLPLAGEGSDFHGLREHREGDDLRRVHWRSTARTGRLVVVERERERRGRYTLLLDTRAAASPEALDGAADLLVSLSRKLVGEGCEVGLRLPDLELPPAGGSQQLRRLADRAAALAPSRESPVPLLPFPGTEGIVLPLVPPPPPPAALAPLPGPVGGQRGRLDLRRTQRGSLLAAVLLSFGSLLLSGELPLWVLLLFGASAFFGLLLDENPSRGLRQGVGILTIGLLLALGGLVFAGALDILIAAPSFAAVLAASRLLARRGPADDPLLLLAALMMLAGGAALTGDLVYGVLFCFFAVVGTVALATTHLRREMEAAEGPTSSARPGTLSGALLVFLAGVSLTVLVGSLFVFLAFPRVTVGALSKRETARVGGGGERIELGGLGVLKDDPTPVMRLRFPEGAPPGERYWRTTVFDRWDGRGWSKAAGEREPVPGGGGFHAFGRGRGKGGYEFEVELLRDVGALPMPARPLSLRFPFRRGAPFPRLYARAGGTLEVEDAPLPLRYRVRAARGETSRSAPEGDWTEVPGDLDPRIRSLAESFRGADDEALARSVESWLQRENRYTRELPGDVDDPLAHFLFRRKEGHCEYFASSLAILLRLRGIPARVVAGYYGMSWVPAGEYWVVREGDAHAWTEAWIEGKGWLRLDATPAEDRPGVAEGAWAFLVEWLDVVRMRWAHWVLDYDARSQMRLASGIAKGFGGGKARGEGFASRLPGALRISGLAALGILAFLFLRRWARREGERAPPIPADQRRAIALYRAVRRRLRRSGIHLDESATAKEWSREAAAVLTPGEAAAVERALRSYEEVRFGGRAMGRGEARSLRRAAGA